jgi:hypothetical protein
MFAVMFFCYSPSVLNESLICIHNEQYVVPERAVGEFPEQQPSEDKCPLTHYVLLIL